MIGINLSHDPEQAVVSPVSRSELYNKMEQTTYRRHICAGLQYFFALPPRFY